MVFVRNCTAARWGGAYLSARLIPETGEEKSRSQKSFSQSAKAWRRQANVGNKQIVPDKNACISAGWEGSLAAMANHPQPLCISDPGSGWFADSPSLGRELLLRAAQGQ